jgi:hypothetical protein
MPQNPGRSTYTWRFLLGSKYLTINRDTGYEIMAIRTTSETALIGNSVGFTVGKVALE